jgi:hypothetical protein
MSQDQDHLDEFARILADSVDKMLAEDWKAQHAVLVLARTADDDEHIELKTVTLEGDPVDTLRLLPADERYIAACISALGYTHDLRDLAAGRKARVRATIAVGRSCDVSLIRQKDGRVDLLEGLTGQTGDIMRRLIQRC